jgi:hypothetical protein
VAHCVRVYNNGDRVLFDTARDEDTQEWLRYNMKNRFGTALFVDGVCKQQGYLSQARCDEIARSLRGERTLAEINADAEIWLQHYLRWYNQKRWEEHFK